MGILTARYGEPLRADQPRPTSESAVELSQGRSDHVMRTDDGRAVNKKEG